MARDLSSSGNYYTHQPFLACSGVTRLSPVNQSGPDCCVVQVSDCAQRCDALPDCYAFAVSVFTNTPLTALLPAAAGGGTWQKCELYAKDVDTSSCRTQLEYFFNRLAAGGFDYDRAAADIWDTYFLSSPPPLPDAGSSTLTVELVLSGVAPAALASDEARLALVFAVQHALQVTCCAANVRLNDVRDAAAAAAAAGRRLAQQGAAPAVRVSFVVVPLSNSNDAYHSFVLAHALEALASPTAQGVLLKQLQATGFPNAVAASWPDVPSATSLTPAAHCEPPRSVLGLAVGLGAPIAVALVALAARLSWFKLMRRSHRRSGRKHDVFISYRRADLQIADAVHDKCALAGLRVFYDRGGKMAGRPFAQELFKAIRDAPCFAPVVTLELMRVLASHRADTVDYLLAELLAALHFSRSGRKHLIFPLLVGEWSKGSEVSGGGERDCLPFNAQFKAARDALPAIVPTATRALVAALLHPEELHPELAEATVRDLILGVAAAEPEAAAMGRVCGLLEQDAVLLHGPDEQAGLVLRHRYAQRIAEALQSSE
jgi:hypothetical protein